MMSLETIRNIRKCRKCELWKHRNNAVPGQGPLDADIMFIGEAPGRQEDAQGEPFVGKAGTVLDEVLDTAGINRGEVFITNIVKCRPPENRTPRKCEVASCKHFLLSEINEVDPDIIVTLGRTSTVAILSWHGITVSGIEDARGTTYETTAGAIVPTYHPAATFYDTTKEDVIQADVSGGIGSKKAEQVLEQLKHNEDVVIEDTSEDTSKQHTLNEVYQT